MKQSLWLLILLFALFFSCKQERSDKFRNDLNNSGIYSSNPVNTEPQEIWKFKTGGRIHASAAYDGENVFIGSEDQKFYALNAKSGKLNWEFKTGGAIYSTATIEGEYIYFLSYDGYLYKLNKNTGNLVWKFQTNGEKLHLIKNYYDYSEIVPGFWDFYQSSPAISGNVIFFGAGNMFYAVNKESGTEVWNYKTDGVVHSSPAIKENKVVFGSFDSRVYCLDTKSGKDIWTFETGRDTAQYIWLGVQASPLINGNKVYIGSRDAKVYCLDLSVGDILWSNDKFEGSWMPSSFSDGGDLIYSGSSDGFSFYAIDKLTGNIDYTIKTSSYTFSSPAINNTMAYIGSANGRLYGIDLTGKQIAWEFKTQGISDTLKIYDGNGELDIEKKRSIMKEMGVDSYQELYDFNEMVFKSVGAVLSSPVVYNGIIYFGSCDGYVYAVSDN